MSICESKAVTGPLVSRESGLTQPMPDEDMDVLLSPKSAPLEDVLSTPTAVEGDLEAALAKIGMLEDMDVQLRSQLEKLIVQRNQLGGEKAARDIEIQHLQAQVELLEADSAGRHNSDSRPTSPRDPDSDALLSQLTSSQADNARLQMQVQSLHSEGAEHQHLLAEQEAQLETLNSKLSIETAARITLERQLQDKQTQQQPDQQAQSAELVTEQPTQAQSQQQSTAHEASDREALTVSDLRSQLRKAQAELAVMADAQKQLKQQLGERTIVLGQKAHQIAHLTAQVNGARVQSGDTPQGSKSVPGKGQQPSVVTSTAHSGVTESLTSAVQQEAEDRLQHDPAGDDDLPATPLQSDPNHPQQSVYTPSDSEDKSYLHSVPATTPTSVVTRAAANHVAGSEDGARPSCLETQFNKSSSAEKSNESNRQGQQQLQPAGSPVKPGVESDSDRSGSQLSPPQSRPSSPRSQSGEASRHDSSQKAVTHFNGYFDKPDEEEQDSISSTRSELSSDETAEDEGQTLEDGNSTLCEAEELRSYLAETQTALRVVTHRAESAEADLQAAMLALDKAEMVLDRLADRKEAAELVGLVSSCFAAFMGAAGVTMYLLQ